MSESVFHGIRLLPGHTRPRQLFVLLHDSGGQAADLMLGAHEFRKAYSEAVLLIPDAPQAFDGGHIGFQWYSVSGITENNHTSRVAEAMPFLYALVRQAQDEFGVPPTDTVLVGFGQGVTMALEFSVLHDGVCGRIISFAGGYAQLPERAAELTTIHLLHGAGDPVVPVSHAYAAYNRLADLQGDVTLDVASAVGHELHPALVTRAIYRLQTCIPLRSWKRALESS